MQRQSILFTGKNELQLVREDVPALAADELLVESTRTMISTGTEGIVLTRSFATGTHWDKWVKYPFRAGYMQTGRVVAMGAAVTGWSVGDRAATRGRHTSHAIVKTAQAAHVPDDVADEEAVWMGLGKITQVGVRAAGHVMGDTVVVIGLGPIGQLVAQYARIMGAADVIAIDTATRRLGLAARHGVTHTLEGTAEQTRDAVMQLTAERGADVVYDATGHPAVLPTALPLARKFGKVVLIGDAGEPRLQTITGDVVVRGVQIIGAHDGHPAGEATDHAPWSGPRMFDLFLQYLAQRRIQTADLVSHRFAPEQAREAYDLLQRDRQSAMGVVFE